MVLAVANDHLRRHANFSHEGGGRLMRELLPIVVELDVGVVALLVELSLIHI